MHQPSKVDSTDALADANPEAIAEEASNEKEMQEYEDMMMLHPELREGGLVAKVVRETKQYSKQAHNHCTRTANASARSLIIQKDTVCLEMFEAFM